MDTLPVRTPCWADAYLYATARPLDKTADWRQLFGGGAPQAGRLGSLFQDLHGALGQWGHEQGIDQLSKLWSTHGQDFLKDPASVLGPLLQKGHEAASGAATARQGTMGGSLADMAATAMGKGRDFVQNNSAGMQEAAQSWGGKPMRVPELITPGAWNRQGPMNPGGGKGTFSTQAGPDGAQEHFFKAMDPITTLLGKHRDAIYARRPQQQGS